MIIKVTGFTFTPIHDFVPKVQQNSYKGPNNFISKYGKERYLALQSVGNNYTGDEFNLNYIPKAPITIKFLSIIYLINNKIIKFFSYYISHNLNII